MHQSYSCRFFPDKDLLVLFVNMFHLLYEDTLALIVLPLVHLWMLQLLTLNRTSPTPRLVK